MNLRLSSDCNEINWAELAEVFRRAPLGGPSPERLRRSFTHSAVACSVWDGPALIGAGRALSEKVAHAAIFDVVLLPEFQGQGIGKQIMARAAPHRRPRPFAIRANRSKVQR